MTDRIRAAIMERLAPLEGEPWCAALADEIKALCLEALATFGLHPRRCLIAMGKDGVLGIDIGDYVKSTEVN